RCRSRLHQGGQEKSARPRQPGWPMRNMRSALYFVFRFAVLGLALAFLASVFAPQWTGRLRGMTGSAEHKPAAAESTPPAQAPHRPAVEREAAPATAGGGAT